MNDKCLVAEMTCNNSAVCDQMFFREFELTAQYAVRRFKEMYYEDEDGESGDGDEIPLDENVLL